MSWTQEKQQGQKATELQNPYLNGAVVEDTTASSHKKG